MKPPLVVSCEQPEGEWTITVEYQGIEGVGTHRLLVSWSRHCRCHAPSRSGCLSQHELRSW